MSLGFSVSGPAPPPSPNVVRGEYSAGDPLGSKKSSYQGIEKSRSIRAAGGLSAGHARGAAPPGSVTPQRKEVSPIWAFPLLALDRRRGRQPRCQRCTNWVSRFLVHEVS